MPVVDRDRLRVIVDGDAAMARELLEMAFAEGRNALASARIACDQDDAASLHELAHAVRGMALTVGALKLAVNADAIVERDLERFAEALSELEVATKLADPLAKS